MMRNKRNVLVLITLAVAFLACSVHFASAGADSEVEARINVKPLADGRIEFAFQVAQDDIAEETESDVVTWGARQLPRINKFPAEPNIDSWYRSSPALLVGEVETRIRVRRLPDGRTEFALQQKEDGELWGELILPRGRYLQESHLTSRVDSWLNSTPVQLATELQIPDGIPVVAEAVLEWRDFDSWTGSDPSFYYGVTQDPLDDSFDTWVVKRARTDDILYETLRLQVSCYDDLFEVFFWEESLPYQSSSDRVRVSYRFDEGEAITERWNHYSNGDDGFYTSDNDGFAEKMRTSSKLVVRVSFYARTLTATFSGVSQMFNTPVQPNITYCGRY